jgi:hypothetical protein
LPHLQAQFTSTICMRMLCTGAIYTHRFQAQFTIKIYKRNLQDQFESAISKRILKAQFIPERNQRIRPLK